MSKLDELFKFLMEQPIAEEDNFTNILALKKSEDLALEFVGGDLVLGKDGTWKLKRN
jgi:hypothetical protein